MLSHYQLMNGYLNALEIESFCLERSPRHSAIDRLLNTLGRQIAELDEPSPRYARGMLEWLRWLVDLLGPYAGVISALATAATAVIAIVALGSTARDSRERSRPMIFAMFREAEHSDSSFDLVVKNFGTSAARDLVVEFDPPLTEEERKDELTDFVAKRYDNPIPLLPPGSELTNTWWGGGITPGGGNELTNQLNTPDEVAVSVSYKGNRFRRYCDKFTLSADTIKLKTYSVSSTSMPGRMKTIAESWTSIAHQSKATHSRMPDIGRRLTVDRPDDAPPSPKTRRRIRDVLAIFRPRR